MTKGAELTLSGPEKAAIIISLLGAEHAGPIVNKIDDNQIRRFVNTLTELQNIPRHIMLSAVAEFITELNRRKGGFLGGKEAVDRVLTSLFSAERLAHFVGTSEETRAPIENGLDSIWSAMKQKKTSELITFLSKQRADVVAPILSQFSPVESGEILAEMPENISVQCITIMANGQMPDDRTLTAIGELVRIEFIHAETTDNGDQSALFVSEVLGVLPRERREKMLDIIMKSDPEKAKLIRGKMLTFEDLPTRLPTSAIPIIFKDFEHDKLLPALKAGAFQSQAAIDYLYANISQRMAGQMKEQVEELAVQSEKEVDKAISGLMVFIGQLEKQKRITLNKPVPVEDAA